MAVNLSKNRAALIAAWNDVLDDKTATDWALFGYEGLSNDLKVVSKGSKGIEEMTEDLNSGQIMYAFLKVLDPKTSLPKNVLINWQGEGAPNVRKGTCANHIRDVSNLFKGAHVTINARTEEEVDPQIIIDRVSKSTGSVYNFKERIEHDVETGPVGTSYKRVIPRQEINSLERDKFWEKEEQEERKRQEEERIRKEEERRQLEFERIKLEAEEAANREEKIKERNRNISQIREAEKVNNVHEKLSREKLLEDSKLEEKERSERADVLRRQRSQEAQQLIAKRTIDARAIFEQNTCAIQMNNRRFSYQINGIQKGEITSNALPTVFSKEQSNEAHILCKDSLPVRLPESEIQVTSIKSALLDNHENKNENTSEKGEREEVFLKSHENPNSVPEESQQWIDESEPKISVTKVSSEIETDQPKAHDQYSSVPNETSNPYINGEYGITARALYDYQAEDDTEISFDPGDIITHIDQIDEGWWQGFGPDGAFGLFPANYVELIQ